MDYWLGIHFFYIHYQDKSNFKKHWNDFLSFYAEPRIGLDLVQGVNIIWIIIFYH